MPMNQHPGRSLLYKYSELKLQFRPDKKPQLRGLQSYVSPSFIYLFFSCEERKAIARILAHQGVKTGHLFCKNFLTLSVINVDHLHTIHIL